MNKFLHLYCGDIAYYSKNGYIMYYNGDFETIKREIIFKNNPPNWKTDLIKIYSEMRKIAGVSTYY